MDIEHYIQAVRDAAEDWAVKKAELIYLEHWRRALLARLAQDSDAPSVSGRDTEALASDAYRTHLEGLKAAVEEEAKALWALKRAEMKVDLWRTQQATARMERKAYNA